MDVKNFNLVSVAIAFGLIQIFSQVESFTVVDCSDKNAHSAELRSVSISSCPDAKGDSCTLKKGETASIDVDFTTGEL